MEPVSPCEAPSISEPETHPVWERLFVQIAASRELRRTPSRTVRCTPSRGARRNPSGAARYASHRLPVWCSETHLLAPHISCPEMPVLGPSVSQCETHPSRRARCVRFLCDGSDGADHGDEDDNDDHRLEHTGDGNDGHDVVGTSIVTTFMVIATMVMRVVMIATATTMMAVITVVRILRMMCF